MKHIKPSHIFIILIVIVAVLALVISIDANPRKTSRKLGVTGGGNGKQLSSTHTHIGTALWDHVRTLSKDDIVAVHPLDKGKYTSSLDVVGGASKKTKHWTEYETWNQLKKDPKAVATYMNLRAKIIDKPDLIWDEVFEIILPKLSDDREYIGLINLGDDGKTLKLKSFEASPIKRDETGTNVVFAYIPSELVRKYASTPALFLFHTHITHERGSPLPSSADLSSSIYQSVTARFAGDVVISQYGAMIYGLDWLGYKAINNAKNWELALRNMTHDVVVSHEAIRSWRPYKISDYIAFYPLHNMYFIVFPLPPMIRESRCCEFVNNIENPIDHEIIEEHSTLMKEHLPKKVYMHTIDRDIEEPPPTDRI